MAETSAAAPRCTCEDSTGAYPPGTHLNYCPLFAAVPRVRAQAEIEKLKRDWLADPCFDLEDAEGFEAHKHELTAFRYQKLYEWRCEHEAEAGVLGLTSRGLHRILVLEKRIAALEAARG